MKKSTISIALMTAIALVGCDSPGVIASSQKVSSSDSLELVSLEIQEYNDCMYNRDSIISHQTHSGMMSDSSAIQNHYGIGSDSANTEYAFYKNMVGGVMPNDSMCLQTSVDGMFHIYCLGDTFLDSLVSSRKEINKKIDASAPKCVNIHE